MAIDRQNCKYRQKWPKSRPFIRLLCLPWVQRFARHIPAHATALDLASGSGRNGRWLMGRGLHVTFLDRDVSAIADLAPAADAEIIKADLETGERFPILGRQFDCVVVTNYLWRDILDDICKAVTPGGLADIRNLRHWQRGIRPTAQSGFFTATWGTGRDRAR